MSKYDALSAVLKSQSRNEVRFKFSEIENGIGFTLPPSARKYPAWWANNEWEGRHCMAWLKEGWLTCELDLASEYVSFVKSET